MNCKTAVFSLLIIISQSAFLNAGVGESAGGEILNSEPGARAMGSGGASVCFFDALSAMQTNPAGLSYLTNPGIFTSYNQGLFKTQYAILGFAKPVPALPAAFAGSIASLQDEDIELNFTNPDGSFKETKTVKAGSDYLANLTYSQLISEGISVGINAKLIQSTLAEQYKATAYAGDIGMLIRPVGGRISMGFAARNFGSGLKYISKEEPLQKEYIGGVSVFILQNAVNKFSLMCDYVQNDGNRSNLGFEYLWRNRFALRGGYRFGYDIDSFTAGFGVNIGGIGIDYAFVSRGDFESSQIVSMRMRFGNESPYNSGESYFNREMFKNAINEWSKVPAGNTDYKKSHDGINAARRYILAKKFYKQGEKFYKAENYKDALENYEKANESIKGYKDVSAKIQTIKNLLPKAVRKSINEAKRELTNDKKTGFDISQPEKIYSRSYEAYKQHDYKLSQDKLNIFWQSIQKVLKEGAQRAVKESADVLNKASDSNIDVSAAERMQQEAVILLKKRKYKLAKIKSDQVKQYVTEKTKEKLKEIEASSKQKGIIKTGKNIAVSNLEARAPLSASEASFITDFLRSAIVNLGIFNVIDRNNMDKILAEQGFQQTGCTTEDCAVQMGKLLNVHYIAIGSCGKLLSRFILTVNVVDVESGQIVFSANEDCYSEKEIEKMATKMAEKIRAKFE